MAVKLPPLSSLRVFEAAARHGSFTRASEELGMTQAAVSYQMKILEERVGTPLFLRRPRQVVLTETGQRIAPIITEAFELLRAAFVMAEDTSHNFLSITTVTTFATNFLAERIGSFQILHDDIAVRLDTSMSLVDFTREDCDLGIRSGDGQWQGVEAHLLIPAIFSPMLSPDLAQSIGGIKKPSDLLKLPLIDASDPWWKLWFDSMGVQSKEFHGNKRSRMGIQMLEARAAEAGQGVAILTPDFYRDALRRGSLVQPFNEICCDEGRGYWLVYPKARRNIPKIKKFRDWLLNEVQKHACSL
ncbi:LysR family transcriptional regulator [Kiloniella spongiae]|uniref:LysR family transcriptional regulator n=1 Tax=Kiloniella spongiae TaxID=1489064 RepID=A0A0H2MH86_9PROT|nr:LysR substrate-binding domain-containing protein [Kiloniella spongiae]KLN60112.1 LysR family transcriptional regulator [Kiloniella spongiae]